jgi:hypothetical protein
MLLVMRRVAAMLGALSLTGCQFLFPTPIDQEADTRPSGAVRAVGDGFLPGEELRAEVTLDGVVAGVGELRAGARCELGGRPVVPVVSEGRSAGIVKMFQSARSDVVTLVDEETSTPVEASWDMRLGERRQALDQVFAESTYRFKQVRELPDKRPKTTFGEIRLPIDGTPHDGHTSLGYLRHWTPEPGTRGHLYAVYGRSVWRADLTYRGVETVTTALGTQRTSRIDGVATKLLGKNLRASTATPIRPFTIWISADERRVPLRVLVETSLAKVALEVVSYRRDPAAERAPLAPCAVGIDEAAVEKGVAAKKRRQEARRKKKQAAAAAPDDAESEDEREEREDREAIEKLLRR